MKKVAVLLSVFLMVSSLSFAAGATNLKIGYIDAQKLILESASGQDARAKMEKLQKDKQVQLDKLEQNIKKIQDQLAARTPAMSEKAKTDLEDQYQTEMRSRERFLKDAQDEMRKKEAALLKPIRDDLDRIIDDYAKKNNFDLVIDIKSPGMIYASERLDITKEILELYNKGGGNGPVKNDKPQQDKGKKK